MPSRKSAESSATRTRIGSVKRNSGGAEPSWPAAYSRSEAGTEGGTASTEHGPRGGEQDLDRGEDDRRRCKTRAGAAGAGSRPRSPRPRAGRRSSSRPSEDPTQASRRERQARRGAARERATMPRRRGCNSGSRRCVRPRGVMRVVGARLRRPGDQRSASVRVCPRTARSPRRAPWRLRARGGPGPSACRHRARRPLRRQTTPCSPRRGDNGRAVAVEAADPRAGTIGERVREHDAVAERRGRLALRSSTSVRYRRMRTSSHCSAP